MRDWASLIDAFSDRQVTYIDTRLTSFESKSHSEVARPLDGCTPAEYIHIFEYLVVIIYATLAVILTGDSLIIALANELSPQTAVTAALIRQ
jgi:hypothetical protein